eukprot:863888-Pyramimonas_sp.AAC.1
MMILALKVLGFDSIHHTDEPLAVVSGHIYIIKEGYGNLNFKFVDFRPSSAILVSNIVFGHLLKRGLRTRATDHNTILNELNIQSFVACVVYATADENEAKKPVAPRDSITGGATKVSWLYYCRLQKKHNSNVAACVPSSHPPRGVRTGS